MKKHCLLLFLCLFDKNVFGAENIKAIEERHAREIAQLKERHAREIDSYQKRINALVALLETKVPPKNDPKNANALCNISAITKPVVKSVE
jgi:hypothetical protein